MNDMALKNNTKLNPHQEGAVDKALRNDGRVLLAHEMGTGKTLTSIAIAEKLKEQGKARRTLAVVPSGLRLNFADNGVKRFTNSSYTIFGSGSEDHTHITDRKIPKSDYYIVSYDMFKRNPEEYIDRTKADTIVVDEMHNFRNKDTANYQQMMNIRGKVRNFIGLTGTPLNNHPYDIVPLIDIVSDGRHNLGGTKASFSKQYLADVKDKDGRFMFYTVKRPQQLKQELHRYVHHASMNDVGREGAPKKVIENVNIEMSPTQIKQYKFVMDQLPFDVREKVRRGMPVDRKEAMHILPKLIQARNVANGIHYLDKRVSLSASAQQTPKLRKALDDVVRHLKETPDGQVVVHSHMLGGGVDVMAQGLRDRGIKAVTYTGRDADKDRQEAVKQFNNGKAKVIVISSAGVTGLNLPNTTLHVALDGHYNPAVIDQIEARGIRAGGQQHRKPEERQVLVKRYRSVFPHTWLSKWGLTPKDTSIDEWIYNLANNKNDSNYQVEQLLKTAAYPSLEDVAQLMDRVANLRFR